MQGRIMLVFRKKENNLNNKYFMRKIIILSEIVEISFVLTAEIIRGLYSLAPESILY